MSLRKRLLDLFFPPKCPFCGKVTEQECICPDCRASLPWTEGAERERKLRGGVRCVSPLWYEEQAREGILRFKFHGGFGAEALGALLAECAAEHYSGDFDTVCWVPVSAKRQRQRGYDQARLLAEHACRQWDTRPEPLLRKVQDNPAQSSLKEAAARRANVLGVYEAEVRVRGKRILLIDDIVTTGSTLEECVRTLKDAGAEDVLCLTLAQSRQREEDRKA